MAKKGLAADKMVAIAAVAAVRFEEAVISRK